MPYRQGQQQPYFEEGVISNADVDAIEDIATIDAAALRTIWVSFTVATAALTSFVVQFKCHSSGTFDTVASVAGDYTAPEGPIMGASGDLTVAGVGSHFLKLDVEGVNEVKLRAAGTSSVITGYWGGN
jgi:NADP-dependent 3-hydroxy acid dehydrogenase YdfG